MKAVHGVNAEEIGGQVDDDRGGDEEDDWTQDDGDA